MIQVTGSFSGNDIANAIHGDPEEAGMLFTEYADRLTSGADRDDLAGWLSDYADSMKDKSRLARLGELLIEASK